MAKQSTVLKKSTVNSRLLPPKDVLAVSQGDKCKLVG